MLIHRLKVAGFLSFGPAGIDLALEPLNVLIGPNGSGKSNLLEAIALLKVVPRDIFEPLSQKGGLQEWLWKGPTPQTAATIEAMLYYPWGGELRHTFTLGQADGRPELTDEQIQPVGEVADKRAALAYYRPPRDPATEASLRAESRDATNPDAAGSLLAHFLEDGIHFRSDYLPNRSLVSAANPKDYPALWYLHQRYEAIRLFRDWSFGPQAELRQPASAHDRPDFLNEQGTNLATVLSNFRGDDKRRLISALQKLYDGIVDIRFAVVGGTVTLFLEESGNREIPVTRLSDGTLRYLCLLSILLHPEPPPLVVIEEPELGLHPDLLPTLTELLLSASERTQLIVTTHSDVIVDALTETPQSVVVCEKHDGQTDMRRLEKDDLAKWLKDYTLGNLWSSGQLGGNRW